jgi:uncharacterized repeat protein (TIGR03806 family)
MSLGIRNFLVALAVVAFAACHSSGGSDPPVDTAAPSTPAGVAAAATGPTTVNVTWNAATDSGGSGMKDYVVYRGGASVAFVTTTSYSDTGLTASTVYSYQIAARDNANNESSRSAIANATTLAAPDTTPPSVPAGLMTTSVQATSVSIAWSAATDLGGAGLREYRVYRNNALLATVTSTTYSDTTVAASTQYSYQVSARDNADNESSRSAVLAVTTPAPADTTPPSTPTGLTTTSLQPTTVALAWTAATDTGGSGLHDYRVYRDGVLLASVSGTNYNDTVAPATQYSYQVSARDNAGNESGRSVALVVTTPAPPDLTPPSAPSGLTTTSVQSDAVALAWNAATDTGGSGLHDYRVYRNGALWATVTGTTYNDTMVAAGTPYSYRVSARDNANNESGLSAALAVTTPAAPDTVPPSVPTGLTPTTVQSTAVSLAWNAATDSSSGVRDYRVYRDDTLLAIVTGTTYDDTTVAPATPYSYRVSASDNADNESSRSAAVPVTTPPDTTEPSVPTGLVTTSIQATAVGLAWSAATDTGGSGLHDYRVYRDGVMVATVTGTAYDDTTVAAATQYRYRVSARDNANNESDPSAELVVTTLTTADTTPPSVPSGLMTTSVQSTAVALAWSAAIDTGGSGLRDYRVYRDNTLLATVTGTSYSDTTVAPQTHYSYQVSASDNSNNESNRSTALPVDTPVDATPPSAPTNFRTTSTQSTAVALAWDAATDTGGSGLHDYRVYRGNVLLATVAVTTYTDTTVAPSAQYSYEVSARDNAGNESSRLALAVTTPADTTAPAVPTGLTTTSIQSTAVALAWNAAVDAGGSGLRDYRVYRDNVLVATVTGTTYNDTTVAPSTLYSYQVSARDNANNESGRSTALAVNTPADTTSPAAPTGLTSSATQSTVVELSWNAATDTGGSGLRDYRVYRNNALIGTVTGTSYSDTTVAPSTLYSYQVSARDNANNESSRSAASVVTTPIDETPPSAPTGLMTTAVQSTAVSLAWNAATDTGGSGLRDYGVYRDNTLVATVTGSTSYTDTTVAPSTTYSYQVAARDNANNESNRSTALAVTTPADTAPPSVPTGLTTTAVQSTAVALAWNAATDTGGSGLHDYRVYRDNVLLATVTGTSYSDTTVAPSTLYSYQVSARDNANNESGRSPALAVTTPADTAAPSVPTGLTTTAVQSTAVALAWNAATDTGGSGLHDYRVYRDNVLLATVTGTSYSDTTVAPLTLYSYQVSARDNAANESGRSAGLPVTTPADTTAPSVPTALMTTAVQSAVVTLAWNSATDTGGSGLHDYRVYRDNALLATVTGTSYSDTTVAPSTQYSYQIAARDNANNESARSTALPVTTLADTTPPLAPTGLTTTAIQSTSVALAWTAATDTGGSGLHDYRVYRDNALVATVTGTTYNDTTVAPSTQYSYQVSARDNANNESARSTALAVSTLGDTTPPSVPTGFTTTAVQSTSVALAWNAATDTGGSGLHDYRVYRDNVLLATVTGTSYSDTTVAPSTLYSYQVSARDNAGNESGRSAGLPVTTPADTTAPSVPTGFTTTSILSTSIALAWNAATDTGGSGLHDYRIYRDNALLATVTGTSYSDTTVAPSTLYSYQVSARDNANNESGRSAALPVTTPADTTPPSVPSGLTTTAVQSTAVSLSWNAPADTGGSGLHDYRVYRDNILLATVTGTSYDDTTVVPTTQYSYQVSARDNANNESGRSTALVVITPADTAPPSAPTGVTTTSVQSTAVALAWNAAADTGGSGLKDYRVYRDNVLLATVTGTSYGDATVAPSTLYSYQVAARDNANNESSRSTALAVSTPADTTPPSVPTGLTSSAPDSTAVELSWNAATDTGGSGLHDYRVYRDNTLIATVTGTSYSDTNVAPSTQYSYQVSARDNANNESNRSASSAVITPLDETPPSAPTGLMTTAVQSTAVALAWNAASDTGGSGLRDYGVYRDNTLVATVTGSTSYTDTTVAPSTIYSYQVAARDNANNESDRSTALAVTTPADTTAPSVPTGLTTTAVQSTAVALAWNAATDTGGSGLHDYRVYRDNVLLATVTGTSYSDTTVAPSTLYSYQVSARDNANNESSRSASLPVTTPADTAAPSVPTGLTTTAVQSTAVALAWNAATDTGGSGLHDYRVYRDNALVATVTGTTYNDTTVAPSTLYSYQASARDNANNESARSTALAVNTPADTTAPAIPTGLTTTSIQSTSVALAWSVATDTGGSGLHDYRVYRDNTLLATVTGTSYTDATVAPSTQYSYQISARDNANNESARSTALAVSTVADTAAPSVPTGFTTTSVQSTSVALAWNAATDTGGSGLHDYRVYRDNVLLATVTGTTYTDATVAPSTQYSYEVSARDNADNESNRANLVTTTPADTTPPSVPTGITTTSIQSTAIALAWNAATDTGGSGLRDYRVYRDNTLLATVTGTTYNDTTVAPSTQYSYQISARDNATNESSRSAGLAVTSLADTTPPAVPTGLMTTSVQSTTVALAWSPATDLGGSGLHDYRVYRDNALVATVAGTTYSDATVAPSTLYSYQVTARDNANNESSRSTALAVTTPADTTPPPIPTGFTTTSVQSTSVALAWNAAVDTGGSGLHDYRVYRDDTLLATVTGTTYTDTTVAPSTLYSYQISARDNANNESSRSTALAVTTPGDATAPSVPTGLMTTAVQPTSVALAWNAATDTGGSGLRDYRVYRDNALLATVSGTTYTDTTVVGSTLYSYQVSARDNALNESTRSSALAVTTPAPPDTTPPSVPTGLTTTSIQPTSVALAWNAATDTGGSGLHDYGVYRNNTLLATVSGTTYNDTNVAPSTQYSYQVSARDNANNESARSTAINVTTTAGVTWGLDTRPSNLTCVAPPRTVGSSTITLTEVLHFLSQPVAAVQAPGDNTRWFMVQSPGQIIAYNVANPTPSVFLDIRSAVRTLGDQEAGLLGLAFHPDFQNNGKLYVFYSGAPTDGNYSIQSRISEFTSANRTTVSPSTERVLLRADKAYTNHNGGQLAFGPDGFLYASFGDGGDGDDPRGNGQSLGTLFGKIIRIDVNNTTGTTQYAIPPGNPFAGGETCPLVASGVDAAHTTRSAAACPEIYASGFRNPWRFSLDRGSAAPDLWVGDVGENRYEEINRVQPGGNYGWDVREGPICHEPEFGCANTGFIDPIVSAPHSTGMWSIIGGFVYRGSAIPTLQGRYLFTDYFENGIHIYDGAETSGYTTILADSGASVSAFAEDNNGELYLVDYYGGKLLRIDPGSGANTSPVPSLLSQTGCVVPENPTQPAPGLIPYAPNAPFWSDGASKDRWVALPNGTQASVAADGDWVLPPGTVLMKNFGLQNQLIETRLLMRHPDGEWAGYTYQWNAQQTEATRVVGGAVVPVGTPSQNWIYPSESQCMNCHTGAAGRSLGLENGQMNHPILYPQTGRTANQITTLAHVGVLPASMPDASTLPVLPDPQGTAPLAQRARAYLHTNCSFCHRPGAGVPGTMDLRYDTLMSATNTCNVTPTTGNLGVAGAKLITPANPEASVLYLRMSRRGQNQMPPLGSNLVDTEGAALLHQWISQMNGTCN